MSKIGSILEGLNREVVSEDVEVINEAPKFDAEELLFSELELPITFKKEVAIPNKLIISFGEGKNRKVKPSDTLDSLDMSAYKDKIIRNFGLFIKRGSTINVRRTEKKTFVFHFGGSEFIEIKKPDVQFFNAMSLDTKDIPTKVMKAYDTIMGMKKSIKSHGLLLDVDSAPFTPLGSLDIELLKLMLGHTYVVQDKNIKLLSDFALVDERV